MEKERKLFICSTVYQLIVAIQIKYSMYKDAYADIIITDIVKNAERVSKKLNESGLFEHSIVVNGKNTELEKGKYIYILPVYKSAFKKAISCDESFVMQKDRYTEIFFANVGGLSYRIAVMLSYCNKSACLSLFEEGVSTYSRIFGNLFCNRKGIKSRIVFRTLQCVENLYIFNPDIVVWNVPINVTKIPEINKYQFQISGILNDIFMYDDIQDSYSEKVIYFEESYFADGVEVGDIDLVNKLAHIYGKNNIIVKTHPRSQTNRFHDLGYKTNKDTAIPWEVIALNLDLNEKILVSMTSSAVVNSFLLLHSEAKLILDYQNMPIENDRVCKTVEVIERMKKIYTNSFEFI